MIRLHPTSTRTDTLFPFTTLFRSECACNLPGRRPMRTQLYDRDALPIGQRQLAQRESRYWRDERAISTDVPEDWSQRPALLRALEITARRARADRTITPWLAVPALLRSMQITQDRKGVV